MSDIFENFFGDGRSGGGPGRGTGGRERGADLRYNLEITLEEAFKGKTAELKIPTSVTCEVCSGTGAKAGSKPRQCPTCGGHGRVRAAQGFFSIERTCPNCHGRGEIIDDPCPGCGGAGRVTRERTLSVNIPAGVEDGTRIRLAGEGEAGLRGGPAGRPLHLPASQAARVLPARRRRPVLPGADLDGHGGARRRVRRADDGWLRRQGEVPEGTQSGKQFRLKGKGMPVLRSRDVGDLYIQVVVETPQKLTKRQRELLMEFDGECSKENHPESAGFFSRVREFFDGLSGSH